MQLIPRPQYIDKIAGLINRGMILILVSQRRVGKSKILELFREWLRCNRPDANVVYINKEYQAFRDMATADQLYDYVAARLPEGADNLWMKCRILRIMKLLFVVFMPKVVAR